LRTPASHSIRLRISCKSLAVHLKRQTWNASAPFAPWLFAIARNKLIDALRRRGRWAFVSIDEFAETIPSEAAAETFPHFEISSHVSGLPPRQRDVLHSIAIDSASIQATASKLSMTQGAVRVALHRAPRGQAENGLSMHANRLKHCIPMITGRISGTTTAFNRVRDSSHWRDFRSM
jgi:hypothetical protein